MKRSLRPLRRRKNGTVLVSVNLTLVQGQDDALIQAVEAAPNRAAFIVDTLRAGVNRFKAVMPGRRFRERKDGRLVLFPVLVFYPGRDEALVRAIEAAPAEMVETAIVEMMRVGGVTSRPSAARLDEPETLNLGGLALEL